MAVVQISKIQHRRGRVNSGGSGLPQLASGELGWAIDEQKLYIGNGSVSEGAPYVGNTEVLTEHTNILDLVGQYQYKRDDSTIQTGSSAAIPIQRSLQERLDDAISARSFGAEGDGVADDTAALQRAIDQLYINVATVGSAKSRIILMLEAGVYKITAPLRIPPYAVLHGAGKDKTFIQQTGNYPVAYTVNSSSTPGNYKDLTDLDALNQPQYLDVEGITFENTVAGYPVVDLIATKNSIFKEVKFKGVWDYVTGTSITITTIADAKTFAVATNHSLAVGDEIFPRVTANGLVANQKYYVKSVPTTTTFTLTSTVDGTELTSFTNGTSLSILAEKLSNNEVGLRLTALSAVVTCSNNYFNNCDFVNVSYAVDSTYDIDSNTFFECKFSQCSRGIRFGHNVNGITAGRLYGPKNNSVIQSTFYQIKEVGFDVVTGTGNSSQSNKYIKVGTDGGTEETAIYSVINFVSSGNVSTGDLFDRSIELTTNPEYINDVRYVGEVTGQIKSEHKFNNSIELLSLQTGSPLLRLPADDSVSHVVHYFYKSQAQSVTRQGSIHINSDMTNDQVHITDDCSVIGNSLNFEKLTFSATLEDADGDSQKDTIYLRYTNTATSENGYINYWYESLS